MSTMIDVTKWIGLRRPLDKRKQSAQKTLRPRLRLELLEQRDAPAATWAFDFGTATSPTAPGFIGTSLVPYSSSTHYGWKTLTGLSATDRGTTDPLTTDFISGKSANFLADVPNGRYDIVATIGDSAALRDHVYVSTQGSSLGSNVTTQAGQFLQVRGRVTVTNGQINFYISDGGGVSPEFALNSVTITAVNPSATGLFDPAMIPSIPAINDPNSLELGVKFRPTANGYITGIRFYKGVENTGTHTGSLWNIYGKLLATATFTNESASGWQQVTFSQPIAVSANTTYVASYHTDGHPALDRDFFAVSGIANGDLYAPSTSQTGGNSVYRYGASAFPTNTIAGSNYWVDVQITNKDNSSPPTASAGADQSGDEGSVIQFQGSTTGVGPMKYTWNFGDGSSTSGTLNPSHKYADDGAYTVTLTATDAFGRLARSTAVATVHTVAPTATLANNGPVLINTSVTIKFTNQYDPSKVDTAAGFRYSYDFNNDGNFDITNSSSSSASTRFSTAGTYVVSGRIQDIDGAFTTYTTTVTVIDAPPPTVDAGPNQTGNEGSTIAFSGSAAGAGPLKYSWSFGDGNTTGGTLTPSHTFADNGAYTVTLTVTDIVGRTAKDTTVITVLNVSPTATLSNNGPVKVNSPVTISFSNQFDPSSADTKAGFKYSYDFNNDGKFDIVDSISASVNKTFSTQGVFTVTGRIKDKNGGFSNYTTSVTITDNNDIYDGLSIPHAHARLWFTPTRLAQARQYFTTHPFTPSLSDPYGNALRYLMTGESSYAQNAITSLMNFTISDSELAGVASDNYRWADWVPVVFDWVYDQMTDSQRSTFISRYNHYTDVIITKNWGGPSMPANNYFWGYWRNEFNWAIATYYENTVEAQKFLDDALKTRWQNAFLPWATNGGAGGVPQEGTQYGRYMLQYATIPLETAKLLGRDLFTETNFYKEATAYLIYSTSPMPVATPNGSLYAQLFPFNDDEQSYGFPRTNDSYYNDFMTIAAQEYASTPLGGYIRQWMSNVGATQSWYQAAVDPGGSGRPLSELTLDYYAPGPADLYAKSGWGPTASSLEFQLGIPSGVGHVHLDSGSFQILRAGQWLTKESTGYADSLTGYGGSGTVGTDSPLATNSLLVGGLGQSFPYYSNGAPIVTRLESRADYTFASVTLSAAYKSSDSRFNNPYAMSVVRDFIYVRALDTLLVFDRVQSQDGGSTAAADVEKAFLLHFHNLPTISGNTVTGVNGDQALRLTTLMPAGQTAPTYRVVDEHTSGQDSSTDAQYRLEEVSTGQAQTYLINVLQARDIAGADVIASMTEDASGFTITLTHPTLGTAVIQLDKGMTSIGGTFGYSPTGTPTQNPLINTVQGIQMTDNGPVWN